MHKHHPGSQGSEDVRSTQLERLRSHIRASYPLRGNALSVTPALSDPVFCSVFSQGNITTRSYVHTLVTYPTAMLLKY